MARNGFVIVMIVAGLFPLLANAQIAFTQNYYYPDSACAKDPVYAAVAILNATCTPSHCTALTDGSGYYGTQSCVTASTASLNLPSTTQYAELIAFQGTSGCTGALTAITAYSLNTCIKFGGGFAEIYACTQNSGLLIQDFSDSACTTVVSTETHALLCINEGSGTVPNYNSYNCTGFTTHASASNLHIEFVWFSVFVGLMSILLFSI